MNRRHFIKAAGIAVGGAALPTGTVAAESDLEYEFLAEAPAPGAEELVVESDWAYVANAGLTTIDLRNPALPVVRGRAEPDHPGDTADVKVDSFETIDRSTGESTGRQRIAGLTANTGQGGVTFFDVSDPASPSLVSFYEAAGSVHNHFLKDGYAYLTINESPSANENGNAPAAFSYARMVIVDVRDPSRPVSLEGGRDGDPDQGANLPDEDQDVRGTGGAWMLRTAQPDMAKSGTNPCHDIYVADAAGDDRYGDDARDADGGRGHRPDRPANSHAAREQEDGSVGGSGELAYLCFWDAGIVVVDVTDKTHPVAVQHFGATEKSDDGSYNNPEYLGGAKSNAHYVEPTPAQDYTFVGAETFPGPQASGDTVIPGDHGGIRAFDTRELDTLNDGGSAIYPDADDVEPGTRTADPSPFEDHVAYLPAPEQPDDVALTSHNFDVTDTKLFTSWYQGGIRAYDLGPLYADDDGDGGDGYSVHAQEPTSPDEIAAFAPDGMAFWTAENLETAESDTWYTVGSDIGKGAVVLELDDVSRRPPE